jgi:hypothetical protein
MAVPEAKRKENVELILPFWHCFTRIKASSLSSIAKSIQRLGLFRLRLASRNPDLTLRPGQYGTARAEIDRIPNALVIPQQAVSQLQGNNQVAVVNSDGKAEIRAVKSRRDLSRDDRRDGRPQGG